MIFYHPDCDLRFSQYGIEIPIEDDRAAKVFDFLQRLNPQLTFASLDLYPPLTRQQLMLVHDKTYVDKLFGNVEQLEKAFLVSYELQDINGNYHRYNPATRKNDFFHARNIILQQASLTFFSSKKSLETGFSYFLGGGMHHAMSFGGRGFCLINDIVIAVKLLQKEKLIKNVWVVDVDVHKGDGTAELTHNDPSITTLSIHMKNGWPLNSGNPNDPWFIPSTIDIGIEKGQEAQYLDQLKNALLTCEKQYPKADLVIIVNGADPYEFDELESSSELNLTKEQLLERDKFIYQFFNDRKIPQSYVMAGGYGKKSWEIYAQFLEFVGQSSPEWSKISSR